MINLIVIIVATALPVGYLLAYLCGDELVPGRKWFFSLMIVSLVLILGLLIFYRNSAMILTLAYIFVVSLLNFLISYDKKFVIKV
jgi:hypothetical protein